MGRFLGHPISFLAYARASWHWSAWTVAVAAAVFGGSELVFLAANIGKILHGGWLPTAHRRHSAARLHDLVARPPDPERQLHGGRGLARRFHRRPRRGA